MSFYPSRAGGRYGKLYATFPKIPLITARYLKKMKNATIIQNTALWFKKNEFWDLGTLKQQGLNLWKIMKIIIEKFQN